MQNKGKSQKAEPNPLRMKAGKWLKQMREARGLSQREMASVLDLEYYTFISQLENGRGRIPKNRYRDWADTLGVDHKYFVKMLLSFYCPETYQVLFSEDGE